jgi:hypothetical protein
MLDSDSHFPTTNAFWPGDAATPTEPEKSAKTETAAAEVKAAAKASARAAIPAKASSVKPAAK